MDPLMALKSVGSLSSGIYHHQAADALREVAGGIPSLEWVSLADVDSSVVHDRNAVSFMYHSCVL
jgi:hypothetical protein